MVGKQQFFWFLIKEVYQQKVIGKRREILDSIAADISGLGVIKRGNLMRYINQRKGRIDL